MHGRKKNKLLLMGSSTVNHNAVKTLVEVRQNSYGLFIAVVETAETTVGTALTVMINAVFQKSRNTTCYSFGATFSEPDYNFTRLDPPPAKASSRTSSSRLIPSFVCRPACNKL